MLLALLLLPASGLLAEPVSVPGGAASLRRLLAIGAERPEADFFPEVHRVLLSGTGSRESWDKSERRRAVVDFAEDHSAWRDEHGCPSVLSTKTEGWAKTRRAIEWLGYRVRGEGTGFEVEPRADDRSRRRQKYLDVLGLPGSEALRRLADGKEVRVECGDGEVELPFGLAAWRETLGLDEKRLNAGNAFLHFVRSVPASRMMVSLHAVDARTREELRSVGGAPGGYAGWKLLHDKALDGFALYPEALVMRGGRIRLPGGDGAEKAWEEVLGTPSADAAQFLVKLFASSSGKAAYVADALRPLPERTARAFVLGPEARGTVAAERFKRLYDAIGRTGRSFGNSQRDPWDFTHAAGFLRTTAGGEIELPGGAGVWLEALAGAGFPSGEAELAPLLASAASRAERPDEALEQLFRREIAGAAGPIPAQKAFVVVSGLVAARPLLADPGTVLLLVRGLDRFLTCYAPLEDLPLEDPTAVRRYLFTLDRLDTSGTDRDAELRAGLFQASVEILAALSRSGSVSDGSARALFASLLEQPLFAVAGTAPSAGIAGFDRWLDGGLLATLREEESRFLGATRTGLLDWDPEDEGPRPAATSDALLAAALTGWSAPAPVAFRGGSYLYDATADGAARRRAFAATQDHVPLGALAHAATERENALAFAREGNVEETRSAVAALLGSLAAIPPGREADERVAATAGAARFVLGTLHTASRENVLALLEAGLGRLDALRAERTLESLAVHVYAGAVLDPDDLAFADALLVKRHSLSWGPRLGVVVPSPFRPTRLETPGDGAALRLAGAFSGLADPLGLLHAGGLVYEPDAFLANDVVRAGLVAPVLLLTPGRLDEDALRFVDLACRAAEELPAALAGHPADARHEAWDALARDLVPASRRNRLVEDGAGSSPEHLSPSDLFRVGRRLALGAVDGLPDVPAAREAREAWARLVARVDEAGARARLAEYGPRPFHQAGLGRLTDVDLPSYERLAEYRVPHVFADRLHDLKIAVARSVAEAGDPVALLPVFLEPALDELLRRARMAYAFDWRPLTGAADGAATETREERLGAALSEGRITRTEGTEPQ
jgi:hypothetical protein